MNEPNILATVDGVNITDADVDAFIANLPQEQQMYASHPQFRKQALDQLVSVYLYAKMAEEEKLDETEEFKKIMESARKDILAQLAMKSVLKDITVSDEECKKFYEENPQHFSKGETVRAKHILVDDEEKCKAILASIESGEKTFENAAKESSSCPSGQKGGDLGEFGKGQMVPEFEQAAFTAEIGQVVGPVNTQFGYHLIKVESKNEASVAAYADVEQMIKQNLLQQKQHQVYSAKAMELRGKYKGK